MREIKFRAFCQNSVIKDIFDVDMIDFKDNLITLRHRDNTNDIEMVDLNAVRLMQYTGLRDKNGVEIYEGDIVKFNPSVPPLGGMPQEDEVGIIKYILNSFLVVTKNNVNYDIDELGDWVVISNIYETPEILKDEK